MISIGLEDQLSCVFFRWHPPCWAAKWTKAITLPTIPQLPTLNQVRDSPAHLGVITAAPHKWGKKHHLTQFLACNFNEKKQQGSQKPSKVIERHFWKIRSSFLGPPVAIYRSVKVMAASKGHRRASRGVSSKAVVASSGFRWG